MSYVKEILEGLFDSFDHHDIPYCVLHGYETLPELAPSDVDIAIDPRQKETLDAIIYALAAKTKSHVVQKLYYDIPCCYYYVLSRASGTKTEIVQLDFLIDHIGINRYYFTSQELIKNRKRFRNFYVPEASTEALYLLLKKVIKAKFLGEHQIKLGLLYLENPSGVEDKLVRYFGDENLSLIKKLIFEGKEAEQADILRLKKTFKRRNISVFKRALALCWLAKRVLYRIKNPTGILVILLSPDGGGKTSVAKGILENLRLGFRRTRYLYWRPGLLPEIRDLLRLRFKTEDGRTNPEPHGRKQRGRFVSYLRFFYYTADYFLGYFKIRFLKTITTLVVMDRYYYDFLVDKRRYAFDVPEWLPRLIAKVLPKPDLVIYLNSDAARIFARKQELPIEEIERQNAMFSAIVQDLSHSHVVNAEKSLGEVIQECSDIIMRAKEFHLARILGRDL